MFRTRRTIIAIGMLIASVGSAGAAADPADRCQGNKAKAAGDYAACRLNAEKKAVIKGTPADSSACEDAFAKKWQKIEAKGGDSCPTTGDATEVQDVVSECTDTIATGLSGSGVPAPDCQGLQATGQTTPVLLNDDGHVQAGAPLAYTDNGNGTITDNRTGLMWERKIQQDDAGNAANLHDADNQHPWNGSCSVSAAECGTDADCGMAGGSCDAGDEQTMSPNGMTIFEWVAALNAANFGGHNDWRIPNIRELLSIVDYGASFPAVDPLFHGASCGTSCASVTDPACGCTRNASYWSSTTYDDDAGEAWQVNYYAGVTDTFPKSSFALFVRAVRGGL